MTDTLKVLGQNNPSATTLTTLYTVPAATSTTVSSVVVCNQASSAGSFRISIQVAAATDDPKQYLFYDTAIGANDTFAATIGITLATTDVLKIYSSSTTISFTAYGVEVS